MQKTLEQYLIADIERDQIDHQLRASRDASGKVTFYIHPAGVNGETLDFVVRGNALVPNVTSDSDVPDTDEVTAFLAKLDAEIVPQDKDEAVYGEEVVAPETGCGSMRPQLAKRVMTGNNFPKSIMKALGLPGVVQEFHLHVKKHAVVEVECRYIPHVQQD